MARGKVIIDDKYCKGCELCVVVCPTGTLEMSSDELNENGYYSAKVKDIETCIACGFCGMMCPDSAITVIRND